MLPFRFGPMRSHATEGSLPDHRTGTIGNRLGVKVTVYVSAILLIDLVLGQSGLLWIFQELFLVD